MMGLGASWRLGSGLKGVVVDGTEAVVVVTSSRCGGRIS